MVSCFRVIVYVVLFFATLGAWAHALTTEQHQPGFRVVVFIDFSSPPKWLYFLPTGCVQEAIFHLMATYNNYEEKYFERLFKAHAFELCPVN